MPLGLVALALSQCGLLSRLRPIGRCALDTTRLPDCIPLTHASRTQYTPYTTHPLPHRRTVRTRHPPTAASLRCRRSRGGGVRGPPLPPSSSRRCRRRRRLHRRRRRHRCRRRSRLRRSGCQKPAPRPLNAEPRRSRKESASNRGTAADADRLRACLARASPLPWLLSSLPPVRQVVRDQKPVHIAEEAGEQSQEQGVEHVGQRQAFCNREKGGTARMVFARRLRLLHARSRCSAMNIIMLQVGCRSACTKINAWCCARWRARMGA